MEPRKPGRLEAFLALASTAIMVWYVIPPSDRQSIKLRVTDVLRRHAGRLAWRAGHKGMADELAGRNLQRYDLAYRLSVVRDGLAHVIEGMKP